jgi:hypothetical protein
LIAEKDEDIFDQELIGILGDLYDQIDAAFADAYGWPLDLSDEDILLRLVALNKERAGQETLGHIRWLRLDYQNPTGQQAAKGKTAPGAKPYPNKSPAVCLRQGGDGLYLAGQPC